MLESWQPNASLTLLKARAALLSATRAFFAERQILEVDPPHLCRSPVTDPHLASFEVYSPSQRSQARFLQTSPEYAMKRLLAAYRVPIYTLGKAFRAGEVGKRHNPEFTMLEWYRPGWDHLQLLAEVDAFLQSLLGTAPTQVISYAALFEQYFQLNPYVASIEQLQAAALKDAWIDKEALPILDRDGWLDLLFTHGIEPHLGQAMPVAVIDFPGSQAALAKKHLVENEPPYEVAERFEFYYCGMELANGFHELTCAQEQRARFIEDLAQREQLNLPAVPVDEDLLLALERGLPPSAGVALGFDRLLMFKCEVEDISQVLPFAWERA